MHDHSGLATPSFRAPRLRVPGGWLAHVAGGRGKHETPRGKTCYKPYWVFGGGGFPPAGGLSHLGASPGFSVFHPSGARVCGAPAAAGASVRFPRSRHRSGPSVARQGISRPRRLHPAEPLGSPALLGPRAVQAPGLRSQGAVRFTSCRSLTPRTAARSLTPESVTSQCGQLPRCKALRRGDRTSTSPRVLRKLRARRRWHPDVSDSRVSPGCLSHLSGGLWKEVAFGLQARNNSYLPGGFGKHSRRDAGRSTPFRPTTPVWQRADRPQGFSRSPIIQAAEPLGSSVQLGPRAVFKPQGFRLSTHAAGHFQAHLRAARGETTNTVVKGFPASGADTASPMSRFPAVRPGPRTSPSSSQPQPASTASFTASFYGRVSRRGMRKVDLAPPARVSCLRVHA